MLSLNSNINALIVQDSLTLTTAAIAQSQQRLSSGLKINSAADDPAGLEVSTALQSSINGLSQGATNASDTVSLLTTAATGLSQVSSALQSLSTLATQAASSTLSTSQRAALQQQAAQQIAQINQTVSHTTYNGLNLLNGSTSTLSVQVGASAGQSVAVNLGGGLSIASLGSGDAAAGTALGSLNGLNLASDGTENTSGSGAAITQVNVVANGQGGLSFTDQNNQALSSTAVSNLFSTSRPNGTSQLSVAAGSALNPNNALAAINASSANGSVPGTSYGTISGLDLDATTGVAASASSTSTITAVSVQSNGQGGLQFVDQNGTALTSGAINGLFGSSANGSLGSLSFATTPSSTFDGVNGAGSPSSTATANGVVPALAQINQLNRPSSVANIDLSTVAGAEQALGVLSNALSTVSSHHTAVGAASARFTTIASDQQALSTDQSNAQSKILDADTAQEQANLSKEQTQQQVQISLLAQANADQAWVLQLLNPATSTS